jgi:hypothetical protein
MATKKPKREKAKTCTCQHVDRLIKAHAALMAPNRKTTTGPYVRVNVVELDRLLDTAVVHDLHPFPATRAVQDEYRPTTYDFIHEHEHEHRLAIVLHPDHGLISVPYWADAQGVDRFHRVSGDIACLLMERYQQTCYRERRGTHGLLT